MIHQSLSTSPHKSGERLKLLEIKTLKRNLSNSAKEKEMKNIKKKWKTFRELTNREWNKSARLKKKQKERLKNLKIK